MVEILKNLFIGDQNDFDNNYFDKNEWSIVHACKEPYHRQALGYKGRGAPQDHPEYLIAVRENRLILNLIDTDDPQYISKEIINFTLDFIDNSLKSGNKVLVHCNRGESRSPCIGLLYLAINNHIPNQSLRDAEIAFRAIYHNYFPNTGMRRFLMTNWSSYCK